MKSRRQRRNRRKTRKGGYKQYLSNVGWSTGYQTLPTGSFGGNSALAASPGLVARTTTNWV